LACMQHHPDAALVCVDSSTDMLDIARGQLPAATFISSRLEDELPVGPFDLVVSAFAIHHLDGEAKRDLFRRVAQALSPEGRFAFLDVVAPTGEVADPIAIEEGVDKPSAVADMIHWLDQAGLQTEMVHLAGDLAILSARQTPQPRHAE
jgi:tRNA (cmo5U34)-methyltransferase